jgi:hypothetical protein
MWYGYHMPHDDSTTFDPSTSTEPRNPAIRKAVRKLAARPRKSLLSLVRAVAADPDKPDWAGMALPARRKLAKQWFYHEAGARWDARKGRYRTITPGGKRGRAALARRGVGTLEEWALVALGADIRVRHRAG